MLQRLKQLKEEATGPFRLLVVIYVALAVVLCIAAASTTNAYSSTSDDIGSFLIAVFYTTVFYWFVVWAILWIIDGFNNRS